MGKSALNFVNAIFVFGLLIVSCSGKKMPEEKKMAEPEVQQVLEDESAEDTIWQEEARYEFYESPDFDFSFNDTIDGALYSLRVNSKTDGNEYMGISAYTKDGKVHAQKHIGVNSVFTFRLYDASDNLIAENSMDRYDLEAYVAVDLLAGSRGDYWNFKGYFDEFGSYFLYTYWMFEDSDVGEDYIVFLNRDLKVKDFFYNSFTGGDGCHCDIESSQDGKTFAFCSRIYRSNGKHNENFKKDLQVTGSFVLNNDYCLVVYNFEGKPPYTNAHIIDNRGVAVKKFDYTGISGALGYIIPRFKVDDQEALFLLDHEKRSLYRIDLNNPLKIDLIKIDDLEKVQEGEVLNENDPAYIQISAETKDFTFEYKDGKFRYYSESKDY